VIPSDIRLRDGVAGQPVAKGERWTSLLALALSIALTMTLSLPARAGGVVSCGGGGHFYTYGTASNTNGQSHWRNGNKAGPYLVINKTVYWGFHSGNQNWDVTPDTSPIVSENANCPT
jgi:hypothetical protein